MSGGSIGDYPYHQMEYFADDLEAILRHEREASDSFAETVERVQRYPKVIRLVAAAMRAIDYRWAGDYSHDSMTQKLDEIEWTIWQSL